MSRAKPVQPPVPLVVDVDGTLLRTDLLHEAALQFVARHPSESWRLVAWTLGGKPRLKAALAGRIGSGAETLPLRDEIVAAIREAQAEGRPVWLASASHRDYVEAVAARIGGIAGIFASDEKVNLSGARKAERLVEAFGEGGFDYAGNGPVDVPVWRVARQALVVGSDGFVRRVRRDLPDARHISAPRPGLRDYLHSLRMYQWAKNLLIFLPLAAGHNYDAATIGRALLALACFCLAASSAYIVNDLLDLPGDRDHARKRLRPFAAGIIPIAHGPPLALLLMAGAAVGALFLPPWFAAVLGLYVVLTLAYSLFLKRRVLIDVITLGMLYTIRVLGGVAAVSIPQSPWLLMFCLFLFLSLAIVKRCAELVRRQAAGEADMLEGRGYRVGDLPVMLGLGAAAGNAAVLVVSLYIMSPEVQRLYTYPERLWLICPLLLYWIGRILILSNRDQMHDDPLIFAFTDRASWVVGLCAAAVVAAAI
jgi:4-hydroxybenzoate polyprenyltransferase/phosphoserine phosphatase